MLANFRVKLEQSYGESLNKLAIKARKATGDTLGWEVEILWFITAELFFLYCCISKSSNAQNPLFAPSLIQNVFNHWSFLLKLKFLALVFIFFASRTMRISWESFANQMDKEAEIRKLECVFMYLINVLFSIILTSFSFHFHLISFFIPLAAILGDFPEISLLKRQDQG